MFKDHIEKYVFNTKYIVAVKHIYTYKIFQYLNCYITYDYFQLIHNNSFIECSDLFFEKKGCKDILINLIRYRLQYVLVLTLSTHS